MGLTKALWHKLLYCFGGGGGDGLAYSYFFLSRPHIRIQSWVDKGWEHVQQVTRIMTALGFYCFQSWMILDKLVDVMSQHIPRKPSQTLLWTVFFFRYGFWSNDLQSVKDKGIWKRGFPEYLIWIRKYDIAEPVCHSVLIRIYVYLYIYRNQNSTYIFYGFYFLPEQPVFVFSPSIPDKDTTLWHSVLFMARHELTPQPQRTAAS